MLTTDLVQKIISAGKVSAGQPEYLAEIKKLRPLGWINQLGPDDWKQATAALEAEDLFPLIRGLTLGERHHRWPGGSASAVIWVFRELERRSPALAEAAADWVLANTSNPYLPFGFQNRGARSLAEYRKEEELRAQRRAAQHECEVRAARERETRSRQRQTAASLRRSALRTNIIKAFDKIPLMEQLEMIASDPLYPINFYPTRCANAGSLQVIVSLPKETRLVLLKKLKGRHKGPWGKFKKRLLEIEKTPYTFQFADRS